MNALQHARKREARMIAAHATQMDTIGRLRAELRAERQAASGRKRTLLDIAQGVPDPQLLAEMSLAVYET